MINDEGEAVPVERLAEASTAASAAVEALITGPTDAEKAAGLRTALPPDTEFLGVSIDGSTATVDVSHQSASPERFAGSVNQLAQVVYTLTSFDNVREVRLLVEGEPVERLSPQGESVANPLERTDYAAEVPMEIEALAPIWTEKDLPSAPPGPDTYRVVLVEHDDFLNVRDVAGVHGYVVGRLVPGSGVVATGRTTEVGQGEWIEVLTPTGTGWVNGFYLTAYPSDTFLPEVDPVSVAEELARQMAAGEDFTDLISEKGLTILHFESQNRFDRQRLRGILDDPTLYESFSATSEDAHVTFRQGTFFEEVAEPFISTLLNNPDRVSFVDRPVQDIGSVINDFLPDLVKGFPHAIFHDPGDDSNGFDFVTWTVFYSYEGDELEVVALRMEK